MIDDEQITTMQLAGVYAKFFTYDFAQNIMRHLGGSYPMNAETLNEQISTRVEQAFGSEQPVALVNANAITRFVFECAEYAMQNNISDKTSLETWQDISARPSAHTEELNALVYSSALTYNATVNDTVMAVIAKDAATAAEAIRQSASARAAHTETGGTLKVFDWGVLGDGTWLNGALLKALDTAKIFKPGEKPSIHYATTAFNFANNKAVLPLLDKDTIVDLRSQIDVLISNSDNPNLANFLDIFSQDMLGDVVLNDARLISLVNTAQIGMTSIPQLIAGVRHVSALIGLSSALLDTARAMDENLTSTTLINRLYAVIDVATLIMVGYEALRETKFAETVIMQVVPSGGPGNSDPVVDVIVNGDMLNTYRSNGGDDTDLVRFGNYLDPRNGTPATNTGYDLPYILARREDVVSQVISEDEERLVKLRNGDAAAIQSSATTILGGVVKSYMEAATESLSSDIPPAIHQRIGRIARQITEPEVKIDLSLEVMSLLSTVTNDPYVAQTAERLGIYMSSSDEYQRIHAQALTIVDSAIGDVVGYISVEAS